MSDYIEGMLTLAQGTKDNELQDGAKVIALLEQAGVAVPERLISAVQRGAWEVSLPAPDYQAVMAAQTREEYQTAYLAYADAVHQARKIQAVQADIRNGWRNIALAEIQQGKKEAVPGIIDRFNSIAPEFVDAVATLPEVDIATATAEDFTRFTHAREIADDLRRVRAAYDAVVPGTAGDSMAADKRWYRIADITSSEQLRLIAEADQRHRSGSFAVLAPFYGIVQHGATLRMVTPAEAREAHDAVRESERARGVVFRVPEPQIQYPALSGT